MKKILYFMSALAVVLGMAACSAEDDIIVEEPTNVPEVAKQMTIVANIEDQATTRASLSGDDTEGYQVLWSDGDQIVMVNNSNLNSTVYTLSQGAGTKSGSFTGAALEDGEYTAYYAYNRFQPESFAEQYNLSKEQISNAPMRGLFTVADGVASPFDFKNACGLLRLNLSGTGTVKGIKVTATEGLVSHFANFKEDGSMGVQDPRGYPALRYINLNCGASGRALKAEAEPYYIAMAPGDYTGVKIEITDFNNHTCTKTLKADKTLNIARAQITPVSLSVTGLTNENVPLTWDSPVGARGTLDGQECVVVDLGGNVGKVAIATKNVGAANENAYGTYLTLFDAALAQKNESWGKGWHMPSLEELKGFNTFWNNASRTHNSTNKTVSVAVSPTSSLIFPITGFYDVAYKRYEGQGEYMELIGCHFVGDDGGTPLSPTAIDTWTSTCVLHGFYATTVSFDYGSLCTDKYTIRPFHKLPITRNTPVGMVGRLGGRDAMVVEVTENGAKKKVCIATKNEGASSETIYYEKNSTKYLDCFGSYYTYAQAQDLCTDGWYIPTLDEAKAIFAHPIYSITQPKNALGSNVYWALPDANTKDSRYARLINVAGKNTLVFQATGIADNSYARGHLGDYWTSTEYEANNTQQCMYGLFSGTTRYLTMLKTDKFSVRLFHAMPK